MRSISDALLEEQKKPTRKPLVKVEVQAYGHPSQSAGIQWELFGWQRFYSGTETKDSHGVAIPSDGSLIRVRKSGANLYLARVTSPGPASDYSTWGSSFGGVTSNAKVAIAAQGTEVIVVSMDAANLWRRISTTSGASWGSWTVMSNARPCERGVAVAYKPNGDLAIVHASDVNDPTSLYIQKRTGGTWSTGLGQRGSYDANIEALAMYYDGDWNIIALVLEGSYLSVVRMVYGDGYKVTAGLWGDDVKIGLGRASVDVAAQVRLRKFEVGWPVGYRLMSLDQQYRYLTARKSPTYWERHQAVVSALAGETLDVSGPFLAKPSSYPVFLSLSRQNQPWLFRLKPGTDFFDYNWNKASFIDASASHGMAIACDSSYIWATQANEVWRSALPSYWEAPSIGSGAGDKITIPVTKIARITEAVDPEQPSDLQVELDNSKGTYNIPGSGAIAVIKRGARVNLHLGYKTTSGDQLSEAARYFIEAMEYKRDPNISNFIMHCIDAWGLLTRYQFNKTVEWNVGSDEFTCYQLIEKVITAVGGALGYKSRSSLITSLYPKLEVSAGESAASVLKRLLGIVPDIIYFFGLDGYIVYPQEGDTIVYKFKFPT